MFGSLCLSPVFKLGPGLGYIAGDFCEFPQGPPASLCPWVPTYPPKRLCNRSQIAQEQGLSACTPHDPYNQVVWAALSKVWLLVFTSMLRTLPADSEVSENATLLSHPNPLPKRLLCTVL